jgi:hypothetical protein
MTEFDVLARGGWLNECERDGLHVLNCSLPNCSSRNALDGGSFQKGWPDPTRSAESRSAHVKGSDCADGGPAEEWYDWATIVGDDLGNISQVSQR